MGIMFITHLILGMVYRSGFSTLCGSFCTCIGAFVDKRIHGICSLLIHILVRCISEISPLHMGVSLNGVPHGTPKSFILMGISMINHPFWGTPDTDTAAICCENLPRLLFLLSAGASGFADSGCCTCFGSAAHG